MCTHSVPPCSSKTAATVWFTKASILQKHENWNAAAHTHAHIAFAAWKIYFTDLSTVIFPFTKQLCHPQSEIQLVVISERQSLQSLWNHKVSHSTAALYLSWSWWAALSLRGFSVLKAGTTYSASPTWVPRDLTCHLQDFLGRVEGVCFLYLLSRSGGRVLANVSIVPLLRHHTKQYTIIDTFHRHPCRRQEQKQDDPIITSVPHIFLSLLWAI